MRRLVLLALILAGCGDPTAPQTLDITRSVVSIGSGPGTSRVDPAGPATVTFDHAMTHVEYMQVVLHEGGATGPKVPANATWSADRRQLTIAPSSPLRSGTSYTVELTCSGMSAGDHAAMMSGMSGMHDGSGMMGSGGMMSGGASDTHRMTFGFTTS